MAAAPPEVLRLSSNVPLFDLDMAAHTKKAPKLVHRTDSPYSETHVYGSRMDNMHTATTDTVLKGQRLNSLTTMF